MSQSVTSVAAGELGETAASTRETRIMLKIKRVYDPSAPADGKRVLVDRLWPRGLKKNDARIDDWLKELGPSTALRKWFGHDPDRWDAFKQRFFSELREHRDLVDGIRKTARKGTVTLLFGSREEHFNNATALKEYIEAARAPGRRKTT